MFVVLCDVVISAPIGEQLPHQAASQIEDKQQHFQNTQLSVSSIFMQDPVTLSFQVMHVSF